MEKLNEMFIISYNLSLSYDEIRKMTDYERKFYVKIIEDKLKLK